MQEDLVHKTFPNAKPFLKWAGGKSQLLNELNKRLPKQILRERSINIYIEPFVGGGAVFFHLKNNYKVKKAFLFDINRELIVGYKVIQADPSKLISSLKRIGENYLKKTEDERKEYYYKIRDLYNKQMDSFDYENYSSDWIDRAKYLIFLNKTCYNGLFRQNSKGEFNVPFGRYKNPKICDEENIYEVHRALDNTEIFCADFSKADSYIKKNSFVYFDPPYLPLSVTSSFTAYSKEGFGREEQERLEKFFTKMHKRGARLMLSNSDPKNENPADDFFDRLYKDYYIERVDAKRFINCDAKGRGAIKELIIRNYSE